MSTEFEVIYCSQSSILLATDCEEDAWEEWSVILASASPPFAISSVCLTQKQSTDTLAVLQSPTTLALCYLWKWTTVSCLSPSIIITANVNVKILGLHSLIQNFLWLLKVIIWIVRRRERTYFLLHLNRIDFFPIALVCLTNWMLFLV